MLTIGEVDVGEVQVPLLIDAGAVDEAEQPDESFARVDVEPHPAA